MGDFALSTQIEETVAKLASKRPPFLLISYSMLCLLSSRKQPPPISSENRLA
jgi:hypothetical protein